MSGRPVVVAVLTFKRPQDLPAAMDAVLAECATLDPPATLLVVDNDPAASARDTVATRPQVRYVCEPEPGIAAARNRALAEVDDDTLLVFLDDDERPRPGWLSRLVETHRERDCAAVVGPVVSEFEVEPDRWVAAGRFFDRRRLPTGTPVTVAATNNLLLDMRRIRALGLTFDRRFGISGGSDTLFTRKLAAAGETLVWNDEAVVVDVVPADRVTREWVLRRAFRSGNSWTRTSLALAEGSAARLWARVVCAARGAIRVVGGGLQSLLGLITGDLGRRVRGIRTVARGAGMVSGAGGVHYKEYAALHRGATVS